MNDFIALLMIIVVYFLPYFLIFKLIKFSSGALGKIQGALDGVGKWGRERGAVKSFQENARKSVDVNRKNKHLETIGAQAAIINSDKNAARKGYARIRRGLARSSIGTLGATGAYGRQMAGQEREATLKNSRIQISEDLIEHGITDYDDTLDYQVALAKGEKTYKIKNGARAGEIVEISSYGSFGQQAATEAIMAAGKADRIRDIRTTLASQGAAGERIWSDAMESQGGNVVKVAADVAGKPVESLRVSEFATQDSGTLRNIAQEYEAALRDVATHPTGTVEYQKAEAKADALQNIAQELTRDPNIYASVNEEGKRYVEYIANGGSFGGATKPTGMSKDYKGANPGASSSTSKTINDAIDSAIATPNDPVGPTRGW